MYCLSVCVCACCAGVVSTFAGSVWGVGGSGDTQAQSMTSSGEGLLDSPLFITASGPLLYVTQAGTHAALRAINTLNGTRAAVCVLTLPFQGVCMRVCVCMVCFPAECVSVCVWQARS